MNPESDESSLEPHKEETVESGEDLAAGPADDAGNADDTASDETPPNEQVETSAETSAESENQQRRQIKIGSQREGDQSATVMKAQPQALDPPVVKEEVVDGAENDISISETSLAGLKGGISPTPNIELETRELSDDLQREVDAALGNLSIDDLMAGAQSDAADELEEGARLKGRVLLVRNDNVFVDVGRRNQGVVSVKQFKEIPSEGDAIEVTVIRFDPEEGLYELIVPNAAVDVSGWDELNEGMLVEAVINGHNKGGLECEVNRLRGFIPVSQISLYRVEDLEQFVGQRLSCVVTEVNAERRNLVLSHRAVLERERAEAKQKLLDELEVGQLREGIVSRLQPFGAFVDLGGVDGLIHISQLSWDRIGHPSEVLEEGQKITVKISKIDAETGKIGLAYRDTFDNPWDAAADKYKPKSTVQGTVSRLTDFGAFVRLEPGIEGLIHISELAHRRVFRSSDVLSEGEKVEVLILSVDAAAQRISLSLKALEARPETVKKKDEEEDEDVPVPSPPLPKAARKESLRGGTNRSSGGDSFGLKW